MSFVMIRVIERNNYGDSLAEIFRYEIDLLLCEDEHNHIVLARGPRKPLALPPGKSAPAQPGDE